MIRVAIPILALAVVAACFRGNLFGGGDPITYPGVDPNTPIEPMPPSNNASPAVTGFGKRVLDAGTG